MEAKIFFTPLVLVAAVSAGIHPIVQGGKVGLIDDRGEIVVPPRYDYAKANGTLLPVRVGSRWGYVDSNGKEVIPPVLEEGLPPAFCGDVAITLYGTELKVLSRDAVHKVVGTADKGLSCSEGLIPVRDIEKKWRFLNATGKPEFDRVFEGAYPFSDGFAAVKLKGKWGYIDRTGNLVIDPKFEDAGPHGEGLFAAKVNGLWGFADNSGKLAIPAEFNMVTRFYEGRAAVAKVVEGGLTRYGYIDRTGRAVTPFRYTYGSNFANGRAMILENGKFGFMGLDGGVVINPQYDDAEPFHDGLAAVKIIKGKQRTAMYINTAGKVVWRGDDIP